ncbi:MAG: hypothetical protein WD691_09970 [Acidimicrobiales bacterium]
MTDGTGMPDSAAALQTTYVASLLAELARLVGELEQMAGVRRAEPASAAAIAAQQAAIVAAAHEEAAAVLAGAHLAAARVLERAAKGEHATDAPPPAAPDHDRSVVDLRDATLATAPVDSVDDHEAPPPPPAAQPPVVQAPTAGVDSPRTPGDPPEADMRASIAAAMDMARGLSQSIQQLARELDESPAP